MTFILNISVALWLGFVAPAFARDFRLQKLTSVALLSYACADILTAPRTVQLQNEAEVMLAVWNVENVLERRGRFERDGVDEPSGLYQFGPPNPAARGVVEWKFTAKQNKIAEAATLMGLPAGTRPHFVITPEVESADAAEQLFNEGRLAGQYRTFITHGNDTRGIDIALAVRSDLNVRVEVETHRDAMWWDPIERANARVFTRDLPVWLIRDGSTQKLLLILVGQHAKSMRDRARGRDPNSQVLRAAQFAASREIIRNYRERFGVQTPIIMAGDFNTDVRTAREMNPLRYQLSEVFDYLNVPERTTHTYHPAPGVVMESQLDACFVSDSVKPFVLRAGVLPEFDFNTGEKMGLPTSLEDRQKHYASDHLAIGLVISGQLFRQN